MMVEAGADHPGVPALLWLPAQQKQPFGGHFTSSLRTLWFIAVLGLLCLIQPIELVADHHAPHYMTIVGGYTQNHTND